MPSGCQPFLTRRFDLALQFASGLHHSQCRKGTPIPYISHLMAVSALVLEAGGDEDLAIAAMPSKTKAALQPYKPSAACLGIALQMSLWNAPTRIANRSRRGASGKSDTWPTFLVHPQTRFLSQWLTSFTTRGQFLRITAGTRKTSGCASPRARKSSSGITESL